MVAIALLLASGCAQVSLQSHVAASAAEALQIADRENDQEAAQRYLLRMAGLFQEEGRHADARTLLQSPQLQTPAPGLERQYLFLAMNGASALTDPDWALSLSQRLSPDTFTTYAGAQMTQAARLQASVYSLAGKPLEAARTLILLAQVSPDADIRTLHDQIWEQLKQVPARKLTAAAEQAFSYESQGWLELAAQLQIPGLSLDEQGRIIRRWQASWPGHPAAQVLPGELQLIADLAVSRPGKIALALPLTGPFGSAGKAIRDGFLAAYYMDDSEDHTRTEIRVFDTSNTAFTSLYEELVSEGFDLVVGPLEKEALATLANNSYLPVPVLGLNYLPQDRSAPQGLYQYGLSAEDEARQIAGRLIRERRDQILALIPRGEWGDRVERALLTRLHAGGGVALDIERFSPEDDLRTVTADLLGISESRDRAIEVERTLGINIEFEPRRRQDADAIVMVAEPTLARQFRPLFAFYFAGDLPVYSPSIIYEGVPEPARDRDLNNVIFTDIPWILGEETKLRRLAQAHLPGTHGQLGRLFAMGADAWQLSKRLQLLKRVDNAAIDGYTGRLTMTPDGRVHREQLWARFEQGTPVLLPEAADTGMDTE